MHLSDHHDRWRISYRQVRLRKEDSETSTNLTDGRRQAHSGQLTAFGQSRARAVQPRQRRAHFGLHCFARLRASPESPKSPRGGLPQECSEDQSHSGRKSWHWTCNYTARERSTRSPQERQMFRAQCDSTAASRNQFRRELVGHWTKAKPGSNAAPSKLNGVDPSADRLIWVWSLQSGASNKDVLCM